VTDPVDPIGRSERISRAARIARGAGAVGGAAAGAPSTASGAIAAFAAQLFAGAPRRGLKGGPEMLEQARTTYLQTEYSGPADRRRKKGRGANTDV
jgi:hypothetical protein